MDKGGSPWSAFRHPAFAVLWTAALVSNTGTWMYNATGRFTEFNRS